MNLINKLLTYIFQNINPIPKILSCLAKKNPILKKEYNLFYSEKSVMRSMEAQQKKIMEEKRRRSERNQNLISELNRINRQAAILAAKSERMRMLKVEIKLNLNKIPDKSLYFNCRNNMNIIC